MTRAYYIQIQLKFIKHYDQIHYSAGSMKVHYNPATIKDTDTIYILHTLHTKQQKNYTQNNKRTTHKTTKELHTKQQKNYTQNNKRTIHKTTKELNTKQQKLHTKQQKNYTQNNKRTTHKTTKELHTKQQKN